MGTLGDFTVHSPLAICDPPIVKAIQQSSQRGALRGSVASVEQTPLLGLALLCVVSNSEAKRRRSVTLELSRYTRPSMLFLHSSTLR